MTWAALLAKWVEASRASIAFPKTPEWDRVRGALPHLIGLQALTRALDELGTLEPDARAAGMDMARVLLAKHGGEVRGAWPEGGAEAMPRAVREIVDDAALALDLAAMGGLEWCVADDAVIAEHPAALLTALVAGGFAGDLYLPTPGVPVFEGCPVAFLRGAAPDAEAEIAEEIAGFLGGVGEAEWRPGPRPVYRQFDFGVGRVVRDVVVAPGTPAPGGQPLLIGAVLGGVVQPVPLPVRGAAAQARVPLVFDEHSSG